MEDFTKRHLITFFLLIPFLSFSQIKIIDNEEHTPVPFATIINESGVFVGCSNQNGILEIDKNAPLPLHRLIIQHLSYYNLPCDWDSVAQTQIIQLKRKSIVIPEITITRNYKEKPQYLMLRGFFRTYQLQDGNPKYYADGIVEYYLRNNTVKNRLLQVRFFRNESLMEILAKRGLIGFDVGKPALPTLSLLSNNKNNYSFEINEERTSISKKGAIVGFMSYNDSVKRTEIYLDKIAPDSVRIFSLFGVSYKTVQENNIENYYSSAANQIREDSLLSQQTFKKAFFIDKNKLPIEFVEFTEFYVFETKPIYKADLKGIKLSSNFELKNESRRDNEYWDRLEEYKIAPLPLFIEKLLGDTLVQY